MKFLSLKNKSNKEQLLDDLYFFYRKLKLKEYFYGGDNITDKIQQEDRGDLNSKLQI